MFSVRHEFPQEWYKFLHPGDTDEEQTLSLKISKNLLPYHLRNKTIEVAQCDLILQLSGLCASGEEQSPEVAYPGEKALTVSVTPADGTASSVTFKSDQALKGMPHATLDGLAVTVTEEEGEWTLVAAPKNIKKIASELRETQESYERLKVNAISDLLVVLGFTIA